MASRPELEAVGKFVARNDYVVTPPRSQPSVILLPSTELTLF